MHTDREQPTPATTERAITTARVPAVTDCLDWDLVDGPALQHRRLPIRVLPAGPRLRVQVRHPSCGRYVDAARLAHHKLDAYEVGIALLCALDAQEHAQ